MRLLKRFFGSTIFRYGVAGGLASLCDVLVFNSLVYFAGAYYLTAAVISNAISFFIRFFLQKYYAFQARSKKNIRRQFAMYGILFALSVALTAFWMFVFVDLLSIHPSVAQIIAIFAVAAVCFFVYRYIIFPEEKQENKEIRNILIITQKVNKDDPVLGFFHKWIEGLAKRFDSVVVICLEKGESSLPENVKVLSLGKEERQSRLQYLIHFYWYVLTEKRNYDAVFVHMNQQYVVLGSIVWKILKKKIYMWRNHVSGGVMTKIAVRLCDKVFCTSEFSYTARYKKTYIMPVGIDTDTFSRGGGIARNPRSILFLGRIAPIKKPDILGRALAILHEKGVDFTASFYGDPLPQDKEYYESLRSAVVESGISERVSFHPGIKNRETVDVYNAHEVSINLSPSGLYDKTIFEAMACETLILASSKSLYGVVPENFIFKERDAADLANKLEKILDLPQKEKAAKGIDFREIVTDNHSLEKLMGRLSYHIK
ncbi:MAG: GtrA family protein [bacterium]|nr:GtrA family protein [bacterium]